MMSRKVSIKHYVVIFLFLAISIAVARTAPPIANWLMGGQDLENTSFQEAETSIGVDTASRLRLKWVTDVGGNISATPAVEGKFLYVPDSNGNFYKMKNKNGAIVWSRKIQDYTGVPGDFARRTPFVTKTSLLFGNQAGQQAKGGAQVLASGQQGHWRPAVGHGC